MFRKILVGYVGGERGAEALALGRSLSSASGAPMDVVTVETGGEDLAEVARSRGSDLVVLGSSHRSGLGRTIPGATVERLLGAAPGAVAVAPARFGEPARGESEWRPLDGHGTDAGMRVIGVGYDGSPASRRALETATELALRNRSALRVYTVARKVNQRFPAEEPTQVPGAPRESDALRAELEEAVRELPPEVRALPVFLRGFEADELIAAAKLGVDLLVIGCRPGGRLRRRFHNSVSGVVAAACKCPVLIVPIAVGAPSGEALGAAS